ncbi:MOSC N-terminal beta barrel domain-containing protein [Pseudomonas putida]|uniref:MOSC N-terminal beta barrel domain-containing protein n=1 Tax=Pseudomonas putida TaxID=303 RepID=UPI0009BAF86A
MAHVVSLFRYPIKGFEGEKLDSVSLEYRKGFPGDRAVAILRSRAAAGAAAYQQLTTYPALVHFLPGKSPVARGRLPPGNPPCATQVKVCPYAETSNRSRRFRLHPGTSRPELRVKSSMLQSSMYQV